MHNIVNKLNCVVRCTFSHVIQIMKRKENSRLCDAHFQFRHRWTGDLTIPHTFLMYVITHFIQYFHLNGYFKFDVKNI